MSEATALTRKQRELLDFIRRYSEANRYSPSFDDMKDALNLRSKSGIHRLVTALVERGCIRRLEHRARSIEVIADENQFPRLRETGFRHYTQECLRSGVGFDKLYGILMHERDQHRRRRGITV